MGAKAIQLALMRAGRVQLECRWTPERRQGSQIEPDGECKRERKRERKRKQNPPAGSISIIHASYLRVGPVAIELRCDALQWLANGQRQDGFARGPYDE